MRQWKKLGIAVLDAFVWKWLDSIGKTTQGHKAQAFSWMIRVPKWASAAWLLVSGTDGLYRELRRSDLLPSMLLFGLEKAMMLLCAN